jgi:Glycosyl transferase family 2
MVAMPRISVILPTYNRAHLVTEAIESVLKQTFTDFELIVVDDGSTDDTEEVVHAFTDPRLRYLKQLNGGASAARNTGVQTATGEFIAFLDSDDLFLPEKLSLQMAKVDDNPKVGLVYGKYLSSIGSEGSLKIAGVCYPQLELRRLLLGPVFHWSTVLVRRLLLEEVGKFEETFGGEDWELTLRLALAGCQMICVPEPVSIVRRQPISNTRDLQYMSSLLAVLDKTFSDPRMPPDLLNLRDMARASQLLRIATSAYVTSRLAMGHEIAQRALATCPSLMSEHFDFLVDILVYRIRGLSLADPEEVLQKVTQYLPGDRIFLRKLKPRLWGRFYEIAAFQSYQLGQRAGCIVNVIRAVSQTPSRLRNRGLFSIFVRSFLGNQIINEIKRVSITLQVNDGR